jgi:hypothetical protein
MIKHAYIGIKRKVYTILFTRRKNLKPSRLGQSLYLNWMVLMFTLMLRWYITFSEEVWAWESCPKVISLRVNCFVAED